MDDDGFTLVELLVVMVLFAVVGTIVSDVMITGLKQQTAITARVSTVNDLRKVMERMSRDVRNSNGRGGATDNSLTLCLGVAGGSRQLTYAKRLLTGGTAVVLDENDYSTSCDANPAVFTGAPPTKVVLSGVPSTAGPLFLYGPVNNYVAPSGSGIDPGTCAVGGAYSVSCVGTVTIVLAAKPASGPALNLTDVVDLRNAS